MRASSLGTTASRRSTPTASCLEPRSGDAELFLGLDDGAPRFSRAAPSRRRCLVGLPPLVDLDAEDAPLFAAALSLAGWHARHRFCANCGQPTEIVRGGWSRRCPACSAEHFPRVDPVVIMLAEHDGRSCSAVSRNIRRAAIRRSPASSRSANSIEEAVAREIDEEAGIAVARRPLCRQPALAVPVLADDRLRPRRASTRAHDRHDRARGRALVHPRRGRGGARRHRRTRPSSRRRARPSPAPCWIIGSAA